MPWHEKGGPRRVASYCALSQRPCPLESFLPWLGLLCLPEPWRVRFGLLTMMRLELDAPILLFTAMEKADQQADHSSLSKVVVNQRKETYSLWELQGVWQ